MWHLSSGEWTIGNTIRSAARLCAAWALFLALFAASPALACEGQVAVCASAGEGSLALIAEGTPATVYADGTADPAVRRVAGDFAKDLGRVSGMDAAVVSDARLLSGEAVVIGVLGQSPAIDDLVARGMVDAAGLAGEWEAYRQQVVENPWPNVVRALVIVGSDRRGAIFGTYDLSEKIGVSPWYWWADVPVERKADLYLTAGAHRDQPGVRYRGFFINDEDPALGGWAKKQFGGVNSQLYEHVFELLLRLKGNYLWPAMWGKSLAEDDPKSLALAAEMGVVLGTSHHEPLTRAHVEWEHAKEAGTASGDWNYATNGAQLRQFWRAGMERFVASGADAVVTVGMRGDGDEAMSEDTAIPLLEKIVADQRAIIADVTGKPAEQTPQVWALYKEVQDYYDQGMRVPDDVTLLFADDNWGQIRRLPPEGAPQRKGGYGVYYHFDYVGGPRSYKWLDTNQVGKVWQQMDLAWQRGARDLWIVNVGDIKPMEVPLSFFMEQAWDPEAMTFEAMEGWSRNWAERTFGAEHGRAVGSLLTRTARLAAIRKPELIDASSFALGEGTGETLDSGEFFEFSRAWNERLREARKIRSELPEAYHAAYFQLVQHRIEALTNLYVIYSSQAWNRRLAEAGDPRANLFAGIVEEYFAKDAEITAAYHALAGGKWDAMMSQSHLGYTSWDDPDQDIMPEVRRVATRLTPDEIENLLQFRIPAAPPGTDFSISASSADRVFDGAGVRWKQAPVGRIIGAVMAYPQGMPASSIEDGVRLEYDVRLEGGATKVAVYLSPTLDTQGRGGLRLGVSLDDGPVQVLTSSLEPTNDPGKNQNQRDWEKAVKDNAHVLIADFGDIPAGNHTLKLWRIDDNILVEQIAIGRDPTVGRYLGLGPRDTGVSVRATPPLQEIDWQSVLRRAKD